MYMFKIFRVRDFPGAPVARTPNFPLDLVPGLGTKILHGCVWGWGVSVGGVCVCVCTKIVHGYVWVCVHVRPPSVCVCARAQSLSHV